MKHHEFNITETLRGYSLLFKTTFDLFSYKKIDEGTKLLISNLDIRKGDVCLDIGCGYGAIGIVMAKLNKTGKVYFADRDFIAVDYAKINCELNTIKNYETFLSDGFSNIKDVDFNIIAANLPSHIAQESLTQIITDAKNRLRANGKFYVVTVNRIGPYIQRLLENVFGNYKKVDHTKMHTVSLAQNL